MVTGVAVAVDGSQPSRAAAEWAADEAARRRVPLTVVHASLWERAGGQEGQGAGTEARDRARRMAADEAAHAARRHPGIEVAAEILPEETVPALLEAGKAADLLVLGHRGVGGFEGLLLGSVALRVVARAEFPVVVVRGTGPAPERGTVVLGVDERTPSSPAADFARDQAVRAGARLDAVHAWEPRLDLSGLAVTMDAGPEQERAGLLLTAVTAPLEESAPGLAVTGRAVAGTAAAALVDASAGADLLVVGSPGRHGPLGSAVHAALHHASCPVAVVPAGT